MLSASFFHSKMEILNILTYEKIDSCVIIEKIEIEDSHGTKCFICKRSSELFGYGND